MAQLLTTCCHVKLVCGKEGQVLPYSDFFYSKERKTLELTIVFGALLPHLNLREVTTAKGSVALQSDAAYWRSVVLLLFSLHI